jgi:hypothetical protein
MRFLPYILAGFLSISFVGLKLYREVQGNIGDFNGNPEGRAYFLYEHNGYEDLRGC